MFIGRSVECEKTALFELAMRKPFMFTKVVNNRRRWRMAAEGMVIQHHLADYFRWKYELRYLEAENHQRWDRNCRNDWRLRNDGGQPSVLGFDAMGPSAQGTFKLSPGKQPTDIHILARFVARPSIAFKRPRLPETQAHDPVTEIKTGCCDVAEFGGNGIEVLCYFVRPWREAEFLESGSTPGTFVLDRNFSPCPPVERLIECLDAGSVSLTSLMQEDMDLDFPTSS